MKDIAITFPSIRPSNLKKVCDAIDKACQRHLYEIIIASPYNLPNGLDESKIKFIKTWAAPTTAWQMCYILANSKYVIDGSDDALFLPNVLDEAIEYYEQNNLQRYDVVSLVLNEGTLDPYTLEKLPEADTHRLPDYFFKISHNVPFWKSCIKKEWNLSLNFLVKTDTFLEIGGFDCGWEYINWALHDFILRLQYLGGKVYDFPKRSLLVAHMPDETGDHAPIHQAQKGPDTQRFNEIYDNLESLSQRVYLSLNNWKEQSQWWTRRFGNET